MQIKSTDFYKRISLLRGHSWRLKKILTSSRFTAEALDFIETNQDRLFFVVGAGRSGTQLISDLLAIPGQSVVFHEPNFREDVVTMPRLRGDAEFAVDYCQRFRSVEIYRRWAGAGDGSFYGEVNGTIRYQIPTIKSLYPRAKLFLMSRDGRGVVRSIMGWEQFYGPGSAGAYALQPVEGDEYYECWSHMSRFEKVCWLWRETNEFLVQHIPSDSRIQLEQITEDYDYFSNKVLSSLRLEVSRDKWTKRVGTRSSNASRKYGFPAWEGWTSEQKASFQKICGETMIKLGYSI